MTKKAWHEQTKIKKVTVNGIEFDSKAESKYYILLTEKIERNEILNFELQPKYILQPAFEKNGKNYKPITYKADFLVTHWDGSKEVIDIKGFEPREFSRIKKMFEYVYRNLELTVLTEAPIKFGGGFITMDHLKKLRKEAVKSGQAPKKEKVKQATKTGKTNRTRRQL